MYYILAVSLGILIGYIIASIRSPKPEILGTLKIATDEGEPYLFLELNNDAKQIFGKKYVTMKVQEISHQ